MSLTPKHFGTDKIITMSVLDNRKVQCDDSVGGRITFVAEELTDNIIDELTVVRPENKAWVLINLGFIQSEKDKRYWSHPDLPNAYLFFDLQTSQLAKLVDLISHLASAKYLYPGGTFVQNPDNDGK